MLFRSIAQALFAPHRIGEVPHFEDCYRAHRKHDRAQARGDPDELEFHRSGFCMTRIERFGRATTLNPAFLYAGTRPVYPAQPVSASAITG